MTRKREPAPDAPAGAAAPDIDVPVLRTDPPAEAIPIPEVHEVPGGAEGAKRRKRRKHAEPEPAAADMVSDEEREAVVGALHLSFDLAFNIIAAKRGPHWRLQAEPVVTVEDGVEVRRLVPQGRMLAEAWTTALTPWLPRIGKAMPWAMAIGMTYFSVIAPRLAVDAERAARHSPTQPELSPDIAP